MANFATNLTCTEHPSRTTALQNVTRIAGEEIELGHCLIIIIIISVLKQIVKLNTEHRILNICRRNGIFSMQIYVAQFLRINVLYLKL